MHANLPHELATIRLHAAHPVRVLSTRHTRTSAGPVAAFSLADLPPLNLRGVERGVDRGVDLGVELFERHASRDELRALQERKREVVQREMSLARELTQVKNKAMLI